MLIRNEDAATMMRLRVPSGPPVKSQEVRLASMFPSAPPAQPDDVELAKVREAIFEILGMNWGIMEVTKMISSHWSIQKSDPGPLKARIFQPEKDQGPLDCCKEIHEVHRFSPHAGGEETEVINGSKRRWPEHRSFGMPVVDRTSRETGGCKGSNPHCIGVSRGACPRRERTRK